jgi:hypothetical protein
MSLIDKIMTLTSSSTTPELSSTTSSFTICPTYFDCKFPSIDKINKVRPIGLVHIIPDNEETILDLQTSLFTLINKSCLVYTMKFQKPIVHVQSMSEQDIRNLKIKEDYEIIAIHPKGMKILLKQERFERLRKRVEHITRNPTLYYQTCLFCIANSKFV